MADHIICSNSNCGYKGEAYLVPRGSTLVLLLTLACCVLPGIIYLLFFMGWDNYCPRCRLNMGRARKGPGLSNWLLVALAVACGLAIKECMRRDDPTAASVNADHNPTALPTSSAPTYPLTGQTSGAAESSPSSTPTPHAHHRHRNRGQ